MNNEQEKAGKGGLNYCRNVSAMQSEGNDEKFVVSVAHDVRLKRMHFDPDAT